MNEKQAMNCRLYVGNIPYNMNEQGLLDVFTHYGFEAERPQVIMDKETGTSKGFGFVDLPSAEIAMQAVREMDGQMVDGRMVKIAPAKERPARGAGGGGAPRGQDEHWGGRGGNEGGRGEHAEPWRDERRRQSR